MVTFLYIDKKVEMKKMNKKIVAILMVTLMSATMFAGMATVTAEEDEYLKEVKEHVTPEQWVEIEELLNKETESRALADLIPKPGSFDQGDDERLWVQAHNDGDAWARPFATNFYLDPYGSNHGIGRDWVYLGLSAGATSRWLSSNDVIYSGTYLCRVWVNSNWGARESNYDNNDAFDTFTFS